MPRRNIKNMIRENDRPSKDDLTEQDEHNNTPLRSSSLKSSPRKADQIAYNSDFSLSELSDNPEAEKDLPQTTTLTNKEYLQQIFPLDFDINKAVINTVPLTDRLGDHSHEITYKGYYRTLGFACTCVKPSKGTNCFDEMIQYEWEMSEKLMPCRNMATYITRYKAKQPSTWFFIKPYYPRGSLAQYWMGNRTQKTTIQPFHILQIAISLFSAMADAHSLHIVLVDISMDTVWLGIDGAAYFSGFKSSLSMRGEHKKLPWISSISSLVSIKNENVEVLRNHIDPIYANILPAVQPGLAFKSEDRPSAAAMLGCFESLRYLALGNVTM
ncbi:hypothetical protein [Parasitella parasitica]|uniref:Protein kinase domain-containing protein n=1 Tax=Parasitella parasitica TaxID=35722 RepID=A0A0B7NIH5_9FUNG|nr:hypothetical protein [Parasitella parasitica]